MGRHPGPRGSYSRTQEPVGRDAYARKGEFLQLLRAVTPAAPLRWHHKPMSWLVSEANSAGSERFQASMVLPSCTQRVQSCGDLALQVDPGATPGWSGGGETPAVTATPSGKARSRWDETPAGSAGVGATPMMGGVTPGWGGATPAYGVTPMGGIGMETPTPGHLPQVLGFQHIMTFAMYLVTASFVCVWQQQCTASEIYWTKALSLLLRSFNLHDCTSEKVLWHGRTDGPSAPGFLVHECI